jgi:hypothetical protein
MHPHNLYSLPTQAQAEATSEAPAENQPEAETVPEGTEEAQPEASSEHAESATEQTESATEAERAAQPESEAQAESKPEEQAESETQAEEAPEAEEETSKDGPYYMTSFPTYMPKGVGSFSPGDAVLNRNTKWIYKEPCEEKGKKRGISMCVLAEQSDALSEKFRVCDVVCRSIRACECFLRVAGIGVHTYNFVCDEHFLIRS